MELRRLIPVAHEALNRARCGELEQVQRALGASDVVGVYGEPEVGVSSITARALDQEPALLVRVDLDSTASNGDVAWLIARGLAGALVDSVELSLLRAPAIAPSSARSALLDLQRALGPDLAGIAVEDQPPSARGEDVSYIHALDRLADLAHDRDLTLWIDHLETPSLTNRHPVRVDELLWTVRSTQQHASLRVVLSCLRPVLPVATDEDAAFHGDGEWIPVRRPDIGAWTIVATELAVHAQMPKPTDKWINRFLRMTGGHPSTMLLALCTRAASTSGLWDDPLELFSFLASQDDGLAARATQHARTLHRLGAHVLSEIANGVGPYEDKPKTVVAETNRAVRRLHLAGLITQPAPRKWAVTNPLLAARLRGSVDVAASNIGEWAVPGPEWSDRDLLMVSTPAA